MDIYLSVTGKIVILVVIIDEKIVYYIFWNLEIIFIYTVFLDDEKIVRIVKKGKIRIPKERKVDEN